MRNAACQLSSAANFLQIIPVLKGGGIFYHQMKNKSLCCLENVLAFLLWFCFTWGKNKSTPILKVGKKLSRNEICPVLVWSSIFFPLCALLKHFKTRVLLEAQKSFTDKCIKAIFTSSLHLFLFRTRTEEHSLTFFQPLPYP